MNRTSLVVALSLALGAMPAGVAAASYQVVSFVLGNGGTSAGGGGFALQGTAGQIAVGSSSSATQVIRHGYWSARDAALAAVEPPPPVELPARPELGPPSPNPARGEVSFAIAMPSAATVRLEVFDLAGRTVGRTSDLRTNAGVKSLHWADPGAAAHVTAGLYYARLVVDGRPAAVRRFVLLK